MSTNIDNINPCILWFVMLFAILVGWGRIYEGENGEPVKEEPKD